MWRLYVFFACRGFRKPPGPLKRGRRKAAQGLGLEGSRPVGWQPAGVPLLRGLGVSDAGWLLSRSASLCVIARHEAIQVILPLLVVAVQGQGFPSLRTSPLPNPPAPFKGEVCRRSATVGGSMFFLEMWGGRRFFWFLWGVRFAFFSKIGCMVEN